MSEVRDDLLRPSLSAADTLVVAPYSVRAMFLTGFFGGPFAALLILLVNSSRLRRLARDLPVAAAILAVILAGMFALHGTEAGAPFLASIEDQLGSRGIRFTYQLLALLIVGAGYIMHRKEQRTADFREVKRPNGWIGGMACVILGGATMVGYLAVIST